MTFTIHAACGRLDAGPVPPPRLLQTPTQEGDYDSQGRCHHRPAYRDGSVCLRCGQDVGRVA